MQLWFKRGSNKVLSGIFMGCALGGIADLLEAGVDELQKRDASEVYVNFFFLKKKKKRQKDKYIFPFVNGSSMLEGQGS